MLACISAFCMEKNSSNPRSTAEWMKFLGFRDGWMAEKWKFRILMRHRVCVDSHDSHISKKILIFARKGTAIVSYAELLDIGNFFGNFKFMSFREFSEILKTRENMIVSCKQL